MSIIRLVQVTKLNPKTINVTVFCDGLQLENEDQLLKIIRDAIEAHIKPDQVLVDNDLRWSDDGGLNWEKS